MWSPSSAARGSQGRARSATGRSSPSPRAREYESVSQQIKGRESYRPIAPVIRAEDRNRFFVANVDSPYMSYAFHATDETRTRAPTIVHVDGISPVQTVTREQNPFVHAVLGALEAEGAAPILADTSITVADSRWSTRRPMPCTSSTPRRWTPSTSATSA